MIKRHIDDICGEMKSYKTNQTIKSKLFKKKIKIFKKNNTLNINPNLKKVFKRCSVREWKKMNKVIEEILIQKDFQLKNDKIIATLILQFLTTESQYLLSSYYYTSSKRLPKIKSKFEDIQFLMKSMMLNNDKDKMHLRFIKQKLNTIGISNFKFVFEEDLNEIKMEDVDKEPLDKNGKNILCHYLNNKRNKNFKINKTRKTQIFDGYFLFFLNLNKYELKDVLFYKHDINFFDYDYEIFVIKKIKS